MKMPIGAFFVAALDKNTDRRYNGVTYE